MQKLNRKGTRAVLVAVAAVVSSAGLAEAGWIPTAAGTYNYLEPTNWDASDINDVFAVTLIGAQTATLNADRTTPGAMDFSYGGNFGLTVRSDDAAPNHTLTLGGNVTVNTSGGTSANVTIGSITANQNLNVNLGGATRTFDVATGRTLTLFNNVVGTGGVTKSGAGELRLTASGNTFAGNISVTGGTLAIGRDGTVSDSNLGDVANSLSLTNATLRIGTANDKSIVFSPRRSITISGNVSLIGPSGYSNNYSDVVIPGNVVGSGSLTLQSSGSTLLSGNNTGINQLTFNGMLRVSSEANLGGNPNSAFTGTGFAAKGFSIMGTELNNLSGHTFPWVSNQGIIWDIQDPANTFTWDKNFNIGLNAATSAGTFTKNGPGTVVVTTAQTYNNVQALAPDTVMNGGVLKIDTTAGGSLPSAGEGNQLGFGGGTLHLEGKTSAAVFQPFQNVKLLAGGGTLIVDNHSGSSTTTANVGDFTTIAAPAAGSSLNIRTINAGSGSANVTSLGLNDATGVIGAGRIILNGSDWASSGSSSAAGVAFDAATDTVTGALTNGTHIAFTATGPGGINLNQGYYVVNATGSTFKLALTSGGPAINLTSSGSGTMTTAGNISAYSAYTTVAAAATPSGTDANHSLLTSTSGTAGAVTLGGAWTTNTLKIASGTSLDLASSTLSLNSGGLLVTNSGDYTIGNGTLVSTNSATTSDLIIHQYGAGKLTIGSTIANGGSGASTLTIAGTGTVVLTSPNTYSGQTYVNQGVLSISNNNQLNNGANTALNLHGGTLRATESVSTGRAVGIGSAGGTLDVVNTKTLTLSGTVSGGRLTLANSDGGAGVLVLSGSNSIGSGVAIDAGVLRLGSNNALGTLGFNTLSFGSSAGTKTLQINGSRTITIAGLTSAATDAVVENGAAGAAVLNVYNGGDNTFAGVLRDGSAGTLAMVKAGGAVLRLTGANLYTGTTTVNNGTLLIDGSLVGASAVTVNNGTLGGSGVVNGAVTLNAGGHIAPGNSPDEITTGAQTWNAGAVYDWELRSVAGVAGTDWDLVTVLGEITVNATEANPFVVRIASLELDNDAGDVSDFNDGSSYQFMIANATSAITFDPTLFSVSTAGLTNSLSGAWAIKRGDDITVLNGDTSELYLTYTAVPEPTLLGMVGALGMLLTRRRAR